jgi:outer membrane receptor protein involved in Fe transport
MKNGLLTLLTGILSCPLFAYAQRTAASGITGRVADSASHQPLEYATITLLKATGLQPVMNTLTDEKGRFHLGGIRSGQYRIGINRKGYTPQLLGTFTADSLQEQELPDIYLGAAPQQLQEVNVAAQRPLLEVRDDKLIYNVENDISRDLLTATEMLRKVPLVTVDPDGNILLRGSTNFRVLLNGKSTSIVARNPKEALRSFPAGLIKTIEVISQPSARYDAEGAAGIINIITRQKYGGYSGSLFGNYNSRNFSGGGGTFNARAGKLGIAAYLGTSYFRNKGRLDGRRESYVPGNRGTLLQSGTSNFDGTYYYGNLELSYDIDSSSSLSIYSNGNLSRNSTHNFQQNLSYDSLGALIQAGNFDVLTRYKSNSYDVGLDYQKKFRQAGHSLSLSLNRNSGTDRQRTDNTQAVEPGDDLHVFNNNDEQHTETTFQLDYARPLPHQQQLEAGAKAILRDIESDYNQQIKNEWILRDNPGRTDIFNYQQNVFAAYATYRIVVRQRLSIQLGGRLEQTYIDASFISSDTTLKTDYLNFIPSVSLAYRPGGQHTFSFAYSRRLQRPWVWNLNPYVNDSDPYNISFGNPALRPELNHSFVLGYTGSLGGLRLTMSADHIFTDRAIEAFTVIDPESNITVSTYANIGRRSASGLNINTVIQPESNWRVQLNARTVYVKLEAGNNTGLSNDGWSGTTFISTDYNLGKGFRAEASLSVNSSKPLLQGRSPGYTNNTFTLRKELFNQKAVVGLHLDQPFQRDIAWRNVLKDPTFYRASTFYYPVRAIRVSFNWKFGQLKESVSRKKGVNNNDIKQNEGGKP